MGPRSSLLAGLGAGVATALALLVAIVLFVPDPAGPAPSGSAPPSGAPSAAPPSDAPPVASIGPDSSGGSAAFHVGEPAPPLIVSQLGGGTIDAAGLRGSPVWVFFTRTDCAPCRDAFPILTGFAARYAEAGLVILAIDTGEDADAVSAFAASIRTDLPLGLDPDGSVAAAWDVTDVPVHVWVDRDGIVRAGAAGSLDAEELARNLQAILPEVVVEP